MCSAQKIIVIINGTGGVGKDTACDLASESFCCRSVSSIDPIKKVAKDLGWTGGKTERDREFLSDLKQLSIRYNDFPNEYLKGVYKEFVDGETEVLFVHIREPQEIQKFKDWVGIACYTLLVLGKDNFYWGNASDDNVKDYEYDAVIKNDGTLEELKEKVVYQLEKWLSKSRG